MVSLIDQCPGNKEPVGPGTRQALCLHPWGTLTSSVAAAIRPFWKQVWNLSALEEQVERVCVVHSIPLCIPLWAQYATVYAFACLSVL